MEENVMIAEIPMKIKTRFTIIGTIILAAITVFGCRNSEVPDAFFNVPENKTDLLFEATGENNEREIALADIFIEDDIEFISLKPNEKGEGLLVMPATFYFFDQKWLVYDPRNEVSNALLFDHNGKFIKYVGKKGKGPDEYVAISLCKINREQKRIEMVDAGTNEILFYDFEGQFINSKSLPILFSDFIRDPYSEGYYLYTLDDFNTGYMSEFGLENDFVLTTTDSSFNPQHGVEEIISSSDAIPYRNNGNKLFYFDTGVGFINNYSNDLYLIGEDGLESLISFKIDGIDFQPKEYIKKADGNRFMNTLEKGFSFVEDISISKRRILQYIMVPSPDPSRRFDPVFLYYDFENNEYEFYSTLEDSSDTYTIGEFSINPHSSNHDAFAMIQPKDLEDLEESDHAVRQELISLLEENIMNPVLALLKFK